MGRGRGSRAQKKAAPDRAGPPGAQKKRRRSRRDGPRVRNQRNRVVSPKKQGRRTIPGRRQRGYGPDRSENDAGEKNVGKKDVGKPWRRTGPGRRAHKKSGAVPEGTGRVCGISGTGSCRRKNRADGRFRADGKEGTDRTARKMTPEKRTSAKRTSASRGAGTGSHTPPRQAMPPGEKGPEPNNPGRPRPHRRSVLPAAVRGKKVHSGNRRPEAECGGATPSRERLRAAPTPCRHARLRPQGHSAHGTAPNGSGPCG